MDSKEEVKGEGYKKKDFKNIRTLRVCSYGKVKVAEHVLTGETVVIKTLDKKRSNQSGDLECIKREIHSLSLMNHPNVIRLLDVIETEKKVLIVMEYAENGELFDEIVHNRKLTEEKACEYFQQIIFGMEHLSDNKISHYSIRPELLLLGFDNSLKISGFILSNTFEENKQRIAKGMPTYVAPEIINGLGADGITADLWSVGVTLYAMLVGSLPFNSDNTTLLYQKIREGVFALPEFLSDDAKDLLKNMIKANPKERYTTKQIKEHPWFSLVKPKEHKGTIISQTVLKELIKYNIDPDYAKICIEENTRNKITMIYYLLLKKFMKEGKI